VDLLRLSSFKDSYNGMTTAGGVILGPARRLVLLDHQALPARAARVAVEVAAASLERVGAVEAAERAETGLTTATMTVGLTTSTTMLGPTTVGPMTAGRVRVDPLALRENPERAAVEVASLGRVAVEVASLARVAVANPARAEAVAVRIGASPTGGVDTATDIGRG